MRNDDPTHWRLTEAIIGACIEVHQVLGPGLLESAYHLCLCHELAVRGLRIEPERALPIDYKGVHLEAGYRLDLVVEGQILIELKAVEHLQKVHESRVITYLKLSGLEVGLLVNFNVAVLTEGIRRLVRTRRPLPRLPGLNR